MNRNKLLLLWLCTVALLIVVLIVPACRNIMRENARNTVTLSMDTTDETEGVGDEAEDVAAQEGTARMRLQTNTEETADCADIVLGIDTGEEVQQVRLWQAEAGVCYFFLPGYAADARITLVKAPENHLTINGRSMKVGDILSDIDWEIPYTLEYADDDREASVQSKTLIFKHSSDLPVVCLTTHSGTMDKIHADREYTEPGALEYYDAQGVCSYVGGVEEIGGRGNSTWGLIKKPYKFKLYEEADLLGGGNCKDYNLIANGYDETKLRNQIASGLAEALGMEYVPKAQMIDLYVNNIYYGNYYLTEDVKVSDDAYLLERELEERYMDGSGFVTGQGDYYVMQNPKQVTEEEIEYISDLFQEFQDAAEQSDGMHPVTGKYYTDYIDLDSFVRKYLVEEISKNYDGGVTSSYFYVPTETKESIIYAGPVWDYDLAFGNCNLDKIVGDPSGVTKLSNHMYGTELFANLYEQEDFYEEMVRVYEQKALPYLDSLLESEIDRMVEESRLSVEMDNIRWSELENRYQYYEEYDNNVRFLKYYIEKRRNFLNEVWLENAVYHNVNFVVDGDVWQILCVRDGELPAFEPAPYQRQELFIGWYAEGNVPFDRYKPVYEDITYYAVWQDLE